MTEMKACPFCQSTRSGVVKNIMGDDWTMCFDCKAEAPTPLWNQRVPDPELIAAIRGLKACAEHDEFCNVNAYHSSHPDECDCGLKAALTRLDTILGGSDAD